MSAADKCPKCSEECWRESVDVEVGIIYGPWGCPACGWSEAPEYDCSEGPAKETDADYVADQFGGLTPRRAVEEATSDWAVPVRHVPVLLEGCEDVE